MNNNEVLVNVGIAEGDRGKSWMYTINNYDAEMENRMQQLECQYHVYGREVGEQGTPHLQGCITFNNSVRFAQVQKMIPGHLTRPKVIDLARNYCMKDGDTFIKDNRKGQGSRTDLKNVCDFIKEGHTLDETAKEFPVEYIKFHAGMTKLTHVYQDNKRRDFKPVVHWYYGDTGTGKTRVVFETEPDLWITSDSLAYFNGYNHQEAVLFDDFRGGFCKFRELLRLLDRYPFIANIKYGSLEFNSKRIYITSNKPPEECYQKPDEDMQQLVRRIDHIVNFKHVAGITVQVVVKGVFRPGPNIEVLEEIIV